MSVRLDIDIESDGGTILIGLVLYILLGSNIGSINQGVLLK